MNPVLVQLAIDGAKSIFSSLTSMASHKMELEMLEKLNKVEDKRIMAKKIALDIQHHGGSHSNPIAGVPVDQGGIKLGFGLDVDDLDPKNKVHLERWNMHFGDIKNLSDDANPSKVHATLRKVARDIVKHPCKECSIHAKKHLKDMRSEGDEFTKADTKDEALVKLCTFKNKVNEMLGKDQFECNQLIQ